MRRLPCWALVVATLASLVETRTFGTCGSAGEVVGASGRIGSLCLGAGRGTLAAVPRGLAPGGLSPPGQPIIVAVPASALESVLRATPTERIQDLVLLCNGMAVERAEVILGVDEASTLTAGCLYFGVLDPGAPPTHGHGAPATALAGRHARAVAELIESAGPRCRVVEANALTPIAERKMLWSAAMWLVCAAHGCTVSEAHILHADLLRDLIAELAAECGQAVNEDLTATLNELRAYSDSMPHVVPSKALAKRELGGRNGWFLRRSADGGRTQPVHLSLLRQVGISDDEIDATINPVAETSAASGERQSMLYHAPSGFNFHAHPHPGRGRAASAVVVGAGIVGASTALELARRGVSVTCVDQRARPAAPTPSHGAMECVDATSGSWAWLNANSKESLSPSYAALNRLGMSLWRAAEPYKDLAQWSGALLVTESEQGDRCGGAYAVHEDLTADVACTLEPMLPPARMPADGQHVHYYPDEGSVCPRAAASAIRTAAEEAGATFSWAAEVSGLICDASGTARGVQLSSGSVVRGDAVVLAAGVGLGTAALGAAIPMRHSPGRLAESHPNRARMQRLYVDATSGVHCLQRSDGRCIVGGDLSGYDIATDSDVSGPRGSGGTGDSVGDDAIGHAEATQLLQRAAKSLPGLPELRLAKTTLAHRVLPADGLPAIGWAADVGAYIVAAHSGVTLAPALAAVAAAEVAEGVDMEVVDAAWRPERFTRLRGGARSDASMLWPRAQALATLHQPALVRLGLGALPPESEEQLAADAAAVMAGLRACTNEAKRAVEALEVVDNGRWVGGRWVANPLVNVVDKVDLLAQTVAAIQRPMAEADGDGDTEPSEAALALQAHLSAARGPFAALGCAAPVWRTVGWARATFEAADGLGAPWEDGCTLASDACNVAFEAAIAALDGGATGLSEGGALSDVEAAVALREAMTSQSLLHGVLDAIGADASGLDAAHAALEAVEPGWQGEDTLEFVRGVGWRNATGVQAARRAAAERWAEVGRPMDSDRPNAS